METRHRLIQLTAENIKRLKVVSLSLKDGVTVVAGDNMQGKSSLLDAVMFLFMGKRHPDPKLLRTGEAKGFVEAETDDLIFKRTINSSGGGSLTIKPKEGRGTYNSPQQFLDDLTQKVCFDPMQFMRAEPKAQASQLRRLLGLDLSVYDEAAKKAFDERTDVNRDFKEAAAVVDNWEYDASATEKQDPAPVRAKLDGIKKLQQDADALRTTADNLDRTRDSYEHHLEGLTKREGEIIVEIADLETALKGVRERIANGKGTVTQAKKEATAARNKAEEAQKAIPDPALLMEELDKIRIHNSNVDNTAQRKEKIAARDELRRKADALTREIEKQERAKADALKAAKFPIDGLSFTGEGITFNGEPLQQASSAEQLRVSVAVSAAMNPSLPVMILKDGSLLDAKSMRLLIDLAKEHDLQILVERIERDEFVSVVIEDGQLVASPQNAGHGGDDKGKFTLES